MSKSLTHDSESVFSDIESYKSYNSSRKMTKDIRNAKRALSKSGKAAPEPIPQGSKTMKVNGKIAKRIKTDSYNKLPSNARICYVYQLADREIFIRSAFVKKHIQKEKTGEEFLIVRAGQYTFWLKHKSIIRLYLFTEELGKPANKNIRDILENINIKLDKLLSDQ